jgi:hypothetical protein
MYAAPPKLNCDIDTEATVIRNNRRVRAARAQRN